MEWKELTKIEVKQLAKDRAILHQAVQLVAAVPRRLLPPDRSDISASLIWNPLNDSLQSRPVSLGKLQVSVGLSLASLNLSIHGETLELIGKTTNQGLDWIRKVLDSEEPNLELPYQIPDYDYDSPLHPSEDGLQEFEKIFANGFALLTTLIDSNPDLEIRCWPHHFDLAVLLPKGPSSSGEDKSIGIGLSPGDSITNQPYLYINTWPTLHPKTFSHEPLSVGHWNVMDWSGAVLTYHELLDSRNQFETAHKFIHQTQSVLADRLSTI